MRIALFDVHQGHERWSDGLVSYLKRKGHSVDRFFKRFPTGRLNHDRVVIWNGCQAEDKRLANLCSERQIPVCYLEVGFFSQSTHAFLSRRGSVGGDLFRDEEIPPLPAEGETFLQNEFDSYSQGASFAVEEKIAGFLQLSSDYAVRQHSRFNSMQEYVYETEALYPGIKVVFKVHPKQRRTKVRARWPLYRGASIWWHMMTSMRVVGINSTTLYESAFAGVPVTALGETPLARHPDKHRAIVHEILLRQFPVGSPDIGEQVHRSVGSFF